MASQKPNAKNGRGQSNVARLSNRHLLGIEGMSLLEIRALLERSNYFADHPTDSYSDALRGKIIVNLFYENSTRTRASFELAAKRLGGSVLNIAVAGSSVKKGETLFDTATTLNAMHPMFWLYAIIVLGAARLLSQYVDAAVINWRRPPRTSHSSIARRADHSAAHWPHRRADSGICGDIANSRVARSNIHLLSTLGAKYALSARQPCYQPRLIRWGLMSIPIWKAALPMQISL